MHPQHAAILDEVEQRRHRLNVTLLRVYHAYCIVLAVILLAMYHQTLIDTRLGSVAPHVFVPLTVVYGLINTALLVLMPRIVHRVGTRQNLVIGIMLWDIVMLVVLLYSSGGVASGFGTLILVTVATTAILLTSRAAFAIPAFASIVLLYEEFYLSLSAPHLDPDYFQAGILGALYFTASATIRLLSRRIREKDIRTLTQATELADLERLNRRIIERMRTGIIVADPADGVRTLNAAARMLLGIGPDTTPERLPEAITRHLRPWRRDIELRPRPFQATPDGAEVRASFSPVRAGDPAGDVIVFLEDAAELQQQALQLKLAALGRLSASIAHELRNPLSAVSHAAQLLRESPELSAADQRLTEIIHSHCQRMNGVIENVLTTSRRQAPNPVRLGLARQLERVTSAFRDARPEARIEISVEPPDMEVRMDRSQLDQVLTNLLSNAIRHSRDHTGRPWAAIEAGIDPRTERPYLNVIDEGTGVDPAKVERLFEPFFTTAQGGTGLGLYLSRELCEANQARLSYHPMAGGGACFRITFAHPDRVIK
ncbi:MAG: HAMP domain-containing histidine kinase [Pseudomonadales bacterium]|nr:HAMP domain-containing histidine kinase [Pseudomonadales bacterium]